MNPTPLSGRVAIVTGGGHGIGAGIVRALAAAGAAGNGVSCGVRVVGPVGPDPG